MTLRGKIYLVIFAVFVMSLGTMLAVQEWVLYPSYLKLEREEATEDIQRCRQAISREIEALRETARDWAKWDAMHEYLLDRNEEFKAQNLTPANMNSAAVDLLALYDLKAQPFIHLSPERAALSEDTINWVISRAAPIAAEMIASENLNATNQGLALAPDTPLLIAVLPVLRSGGDGPIHGALLMARALNPKAIGRLNEQTRIPFDLRRIEGGGLTPKEKEIADKLAGSSLVEIQEKSPAKLTAFGVVPEMGGSPGLLIEARLDRPIILEGRRILKTGMIVVVTLGLASFLTFFLFIRFGLIRRLNRLIAEVKLVGENPEQKGVITASRSDELGLIGAEVQRMVDRIQENDRALKESEERFRTVFEEGPLGVAIIGEDGRYRQVNRRLSEMLGYPEEELLQKSFTDFIHPEDLTETTRIRGNMRAMDSTEVSVERRYVSRSGETRWAHVTERIIRDEQRRPLYDVAIIEDVTERREIQSDLDRTREQLARQVQDLAQRNIEISMLNQLSAHLQTCETRQEIRDALVHSGPKLFPIFSGGIYLFDDESDGRLAARWGKEDVPPSIHREDCWALRRGRSYVYSPNAIEPCCPHAAKPLASSVCLPLQAEGRVLGLLHLRTADALASVTDAHQLASTLADMTALALSNLDLRQRLQEQSVRDALTGLLNRRYWEEALAKELSRARRQKSRLDLLILDIDHFKNINDQFGHDAGDVLLKAVAGCLNAQFRSGDVVSRIGGEEFAVLMADAPANFAIQRAEKVREAVKSLVVRHAERELPRATISVGVASFPDHGDSGEEIFRNADQALYRAKREGRDRVIISGADSTRAGGRTGNAPQPIE